MVTERKNKDYPVSYCYSETKSELSSDSESFEGFINSTRSKNHSQKKKKSVIDNSLNLSLEVLEKFEDKDNPDTEADCASNRKRLRATSSSEESLETSSRSVSPEIGYDGENETITPNSNNNLK